VRGVMAGRLPTQKLFTAEVAEESFKTEFV